MGGRVLTTNCCSPLVSEAAALDDDDELKLDEMIEFDMTLVGDIWAGVGLDGDVSVGCSWVLRPPSFDHDRFWTLGLLAGFGGGIGATTGLDVDVDVDDDEDEDDENGEASCDDTDEDLTTDWAIDEGAVGCDEEEDEFDGSWRLGDSTREFDSDDEDVDDEDEDDEEDDEDNIGEMGHSKCDDWSGVWWVVDTTVGGVVVDEVETNLRLDSDDWASK